MEYMIFTGNNAESIKQFVTSRGHAASIDSGDLYVGAKEASDFVGVGQAVMLDGDLVTIGMPSDRMLGEPFLARMAELPPSEQS